MTSKHQHQINICASFKSSSSLLLVVVVVLLLLLLLSVVDPGEGPEGHGPPPYFEAKLRSEGPKTRLPPPPHPFLRVCMTGLPPLSEMLDPPLIFILLLLILLLIFFLFSDF